MARQKRIEFPGAFYHVMSRGNRKQAIFLSDDDRFLFLNCLRDACEKCCAITHAYCLMDSHYHLFVETPLGDLSRLMHDINTAYAVYFNRKHEYVGHPFQGRFKAILVQAESYAIDLAAYIHLNPVRAHIVGYPEDYAWSNYLAYISHDASLSWTSTSLVLGQFNLSLDASKGAYHDYVLKKMTEKTADPFAEANKIGILGDREFVHKIAADCLREVSPYYNRELPQVNRLRPQPRLEDIQLNSESIFGPASRYSRKVAIYLSHKLTRMPLKIIGEYFNIGISGVTDVCRRVRRDMVSNETLASGIAEIERNVCDRPGKAISKEPYHGNARKTGIA